MALLKGQMLAFGCGLSQEHMLISQSLSGAYTWDLCLGSCAAETGEGWGGGTVMISTQGSLYSGTSESRCTWRSRGDLGADF